MFEEPGDLARVEVKVAAKVLVAKVLVGRSLLEAERDPAIELDFYEAPPLVRSLLGQPAAPEAELRSLHERVARYHEHQGAHVTRLWTDHIEAVHHYRLAGLHLDADRLAEGTARLLLR